LSLADSALEVFMTSTALAALAVVLAVANTASAQTVPAEPPATNAKITARGCVSAAQRDGSQEARSAPSASPTAEIATNEANSGEFVNAYILTNATLVNGGQTTGTAGNATNTYMSTPSSFTLQGLEQELAKHKGHRVEVVGTVMPPTASAKGPVTKAVAEGIQRLRISSVKMLGTDCKAK
jgi:hypothetical protein